MKRAVVLEADGNEHSVRSLGGRRTRQFDGAGWLDWVRLQADGRDTVCTGERVRQQQQPSGMQSSFNLMSREGRYLLVDRWK